MVQKSSDSKGDRPNLTADNMTDKIGSSLNRKAAQTMFENILQPTHLLLILFIVLIIFGPKKLPEVGKSLGLAIRGLKEGMNQAKEAMNQPEDKTSSDKSAIQKEKIE
jgi:sec-independent protein translocase protein TatA